MAPPPLPAAVEEEGRKQARIKSIKRAMRKKPWTKGNFACHRCGEHGHYRSACKKVHAVPPVAAPPVATPPVAAPPPVAETAARELCKCCGDDAHESRMCRRFKTRMCDDPDCSPERCPYAHSAAELRSTIWFHTKMCHAAVHTPECRRAFAHTEEERWNSLSALTAVHMLSQVLC